MGNCNLRQTKTVNKRFAAIAGRHLEIIEQSEMMTKKTLKTCKKGHQYYKGSDCPTCPTCEENRKPKDGFISLLSAPARRAIENAEIMSLKQLSQYSEKDLLKLHGIGKTAIPIIKSELNKAGLAFKD